MDESSNDFGLLTRLEAEAIGPPGQRTFRVIAANESERTAVLWLEKEQLQALGEAIDRLLAQIGPRRTKRLDVVPPPPAPAAPLLDTPAVEFKVGQLGLGFDADRKLCLLVAHDVEADSDVPGFRCQIAPTRFRDVAVQIAGIIASGRPVCPLCGSAISDEPHFCPPSNGHLHAAEE